MSHYTLSSQSVSTQMQGPLFDPCIHNCFTSFFPRITLRNCYFLMMQYVCICTCVMRRPKELIKFVVYINMYVVNLSKCSKTCKGTHYTVRESKHSFPLYLFPLVFPVSVPVPEPVGGGQTVARHCQDHAGGSAADHRPPEGHTAVRVRAESPGERRGHTPSAQPLGSKQRPRH